MEQLAVELLCFFAKKGTEPYFESGCSPLEEILANKVGIFSLG